MKGPTYTFTNGPGFHMQKNVTKATVFNLIIEMNRRLGPDYFFDLEPGSEGGIVFKSWPGKDADDKSSYKSVCFGFTESGKWPVIEADATISSWEDNYDVLYTCHYEYGKKREWHMFLKALYGAPCWTMNELNALSASLRELGYFLVKGKRGTSDVPKKFANKIISHGDLGKRK